MGSVTRRLRIGFAALVLLFVGAVLVQLFVGGRLQADLARRAQRWEAARAANDQAMQDMTDAETAVRGFQLTGDHLFLEPYDRGRVAVRGSLDELAARVDGAVRDLATAERRAADEWLTAYAEPIVTAGVADADTARAADGKRRFDRLRAAHAAVDAAIQDQRVRLARDSRRLTTTERVVFAVLAVAFVVVAARLAASGQRDLLAPLAHLRRTLHRLAAGERSARAVPGGPEEMRAVIVGLNHLAGETERLIDAETARAARGELRQAVAGELHADREPAAVAARLAHVIGTASAADAVHLELSVAAGTTVAARWPPDAPALSARDREHAVVLAGDDECAPGLLCLARAAAWSPEERELIGALAQDIEHTVGQWRLQRRQARLITDLQELDERKDTFVATVTHELRTPLTSILGFAELLSEGGTGPLPAAAQRSVAAILRNAHRLQDTVADLLILDGSKGGLPAERAPLELSALVRTAARDLEPVAADKGVVLTGAGEGPLWVDADPAHLERAVLNLLGNAVKFTNPGGRVTYHLTATPDRVLFSVTDTGIGIPADQLAHLFVPFNRATNAVSGAVQGSGLGLAIVHNIVREHAGTVTARSQLGEGSTFQVSLPIVPAPI